MRARSFAGPIATLVLASLAAAQTPKTTEGPPGMVFVPGGRTKVGTEDAELERLIAVDAEGQAYGGALSAETPRHEVDVAGFWLMATEVTNEQYAVHVRASGVRPPELWGEARIEQGRARHFAEQESLRAQALVQGKAAPDPLPFDRHAWWLAHWNDPGIEGPAWEVPAGDGPQPVVFVDWNDARAYARWAGLRLMTELEYERAVRGDSARTYPWGNDWEDGKYAATSLPEKRSGASPVGRFPSGASRQGAFDLAGNVWEWTSSPYLPFPGYQPRVLEVGFGAARRKINALADWNGEQRVVVGGSFQNGKLMARATTRRAADRGQAADALGFRCAASPRPGFDTAIAILENDLSPNVRPRDARGTVEFATEATVCADGWATASAGALASPAPPPWPTPAGYAVIAGYRFALFTPVRVVPANDPGGLEKLAAAENLVSLGFLSTNVALLEPDLPAGSYLVSWRAKGVRLLSASAGRSAEEVPLEEALRIDVTLDQLILIDLAGRPRLALPCKLEWENARESRASWLDPSAVPQTGGTKTPEGSRLLRFDLCLPSRSGQKGFVFGLTLRLAPDPLNVSWRPR
jgi:formylglycine-generating enzyme required for sulfatase activity